MRRPLTYVSITALIVGLAFVLTINDFLAINRRVEANILVVEGWAYNRPAIREAAEEFERGQYRILVTVGGPNDGVEANPDQTSSAVLAANRLQELGIDKRHIVALTVPGVSRHRTYASALALRNWLRDSGTQPTGVNVFTIGPHARKSLVLFSRALGPGIAVGVIAGTDDDYDPDRWWVSARGIYVISRKLLGYLYAVTWPFPENLSLNAT
jgi:hypothetical protein